MRFRRQWRWEPHGGVVHLTNRRRSELRDGCGRMGAAVGAILARASLLMKPWGDEEPRNRWLEFEGWLFGACMLISALALIGAALR